jgi:hypothetical protein
VTISLTIEQGSFPLSLQLIHLFNICIGKDLNLKTRRRMDINIDSMLVYLMKDKGSQIVIRLDGCGCVSRCSIVVITSFSVFDWKI